LALDFGAVFGWGGIGSYVGRKYYDCRDKDVTSCNNEGTGVVRADKDIKNVEFDSTDFSLLL
jgi:hypothetical protein